MNKQEFLDRLRVALSGRVSASLVEENVSYYEEYINTQVRLGRSENMVLAGLGDPRLIAKSIITANNGDIKVENYNYTESAKERSFGSQNSYYADTRENNSPRILRILSWVWLLVVILVLVLIFSVIFSLISFLLPFVPVALVIFFFIKLYKDWLK
ncbi:MAG: DUF1700 domain-containing protein [Lachnospiraceae bacterium]|nr:DUF1700 domain-containing protein [Lachnospiraceae bacterium]